MSHSAYFSPVSERSSPDGVGHAVKTEGVVHKAAWELSAAVDYAVPLLTLLLFSHSHAPLGSSSLYTLEDENVLERSAVRPFQLAATVLRFVFLAPYDGAVQPL